MTERGVVRSAEGGVERLGEEWSDWSYRIDTLDVTVESHPAAKVVDHTPDEGVAKVRLKLGVDGHVL